MARRLSERWQALFWRGAVTVIFAVSAFAWPVMTLSAVLVLFGFFAMLDGALSFALAMREAPRTRWSFALLAEGLFGMIAGGLALFLPGVTLSFVVALVSAWAIVTGLLEVAAATALAGPPHVRVPLAVGGVASVSAGVLIALRPTAGAVVVAWILGAYALAFGALLLVIAIRLRGGTRTALRGA